MPHQEVCFPSACTNGSPVSVKKVGMRVTQSLRFVTRANLRTQKSLPAQERLIAS